MLNRDQLSIKENINLFKYNTGLFFKTCQTLTPDLIHCQYCHVLKILSDETIFRIYDFYDTSFWLSTKVYNYNWNLPFPSGMYSLSNGMWRPEFTVRMWSPTFPAPCYKCSKFNKKNNKYIHNKYPNNPILLSQMWINWLDPLT